MSKGTWLGDLVIICLVIKLFAVHHLLFVFVSFCTSLQVSWLLVFFFTPPKTGVEGHLAGGPSHHVFFDIPKNVGSSDFSPCTRPWPPPLPRRFRPAGGTAGAGAPGAPEATCPRLLFGALELGPKQLSVLPVSGKQRDPQKSSEKKGELILGKDLGPQQQTKPIACLVSGYAWVVENKANHEKAKTNRHGS